MRLPRRHAYLLVLFCTCIFMLVTVAQATYSYPDTFFTDNIAATGTSPDATAMETALFNRLNQAAVAIDLAIFDFNRVRIRDALIAAHQRGVTVRVVTDDDAYANPSYIPHFAALENAGIAVVPDTRSAIMHNKFFIIDGVVVWTGSTNITDNGFTLNHNNSAVFTDTALAQIYTREFEEMFVNGRFGHDKPLTLTTTLTYNGRPLEIYFAPQDDPLVEVVNTVSTAQESIYFSIFFFTEDSLRDALLGRVQAGVDVRGVWDNLGAANVYSDDEALCAGGVPIKIEDFPGKMHNKFIVIDADGDNPRVITGSMNWTGSGGGDNDENTLIYHERYTAQAYRSAFFHLYDSLGPATRCPDTQHSYATYLPLTLIAATGAQPTIDFLEINYNPAGNDLAGEHVWLHNSSALPADLQGWTLSDSAGNSFTFPTFILAPNATFRVWTGSGANTSVDLFWNHSGAVWNNSGDTAFLRLPDGTLVASCAYSGGASVADCRELAGQKAAATGTNILQSTSKP